MPTQNLNTYYYSKYKSILDYGHYFDLTLAPDEKDYDEEVVFSNKLIAENDGNRLPIFIDLSSNDSSEQQSILFNSYVSGATIVSKNYYNPNNLNLTLDCYSAFTGTCDVGLVGTDNGLFNQMSGQTLYYTKGIRNDFKFNPHYYDARFKMHTVTGYTSTPNQRFSGITKNTKYNIVSKSATTIGYYQELYGGFYQGFYKLKGYDYEVMPERMNKGWTVEMVLKPRLSSQFDINTQTEEYLNTIYPKNSGTFFFFGARSENKYYHFADGSPESNSGYTRVTSGLTNIMSCACADTGVTNSDCITIYPKSATTITHNIGCGCGACISQSPTPPLDPMFDVLSNTMSIRFSGCPLNPRLCVKVIKITGDCVTTGTCSTTGLTFQTGYTITEFCSPQIYNICDYDCDDDSLVFDEKWVMVSATFERYTTIEECDLINLGGLGDLRQVTHQSVINGTSYNLIMPPETHLGSKKENLVHRVRFDREWFDDTWYRMGKLKLHINGYLFMVIENFEEIIPRELNTEKEKQIGVPFNLSFGGGSQGLHNHLIFSSSTIPYGPYIQDPELLPNNILSGTTLSGINANILIEQNFGGSFMGGVSQFRMYVEPLGSPQIQHNFRILKDRFDLFNYWCPDCLTSICSTEFISEWKTTSMDEYIYLPYSSGGTYNGTIDWGDGTTSANTYENRYHKYYMNGNYTIKIIGQIVNFNFGLNNPHSVSKLLSVNQWGDCLNLVNANSAFSGCSNLNLSGVTDVLNISYLSNMSNMFADCGNLTTINNATLWDVSNVTNMEGMFKNNLVFNQNLSSWCVILIPTLPSNFNYNTPLWTLSKPIWGNSANISYSGLPFCQTITSGQSVTQTGKLGGTYSSTVGLSIDSNTGLITPSGSTFGTYEVKYVTQASGGCESITATTSITITDQPSATISYSGTPFCIGIASEQNVTQVGTTGGTYSVSPSGLTINVSTGSIIPSTSTAGTYNVNYTMASSGGCLSASTATTIIISPQPCP